MISYWPKTQEFYSKKHSFVFDINKLSEGQHLSPIDVEPNSSRSVHIKS